jgi:hypothetical protein
MAPLSHNLAPFKGASFQRMVCNIKSQSFRKEGVDKKNAMV